MSRWNPVIGCAVAHCGRPHHCRGYCLRHYVRYQRHGDPLKGAYTVGASWGLFDSLVSVETEACILWPGRTINGYPALTRNRTNCPGHVEALTRTAGPRPSATHQAAHSCGVKTCINHRHLRWATAKENSDDKWRHGTMAIGERQGSHVLTEADVLEIRASHANGAQRRALAERYNTCLSNINRIVNGETWRHLLSAAHRQENP